LSTIVLFPFCFKAKQWIIQDRNALVSGEAQGMGKKTVSDIKGGTKENYESIEDV